MTTPRTNTIGETLSKHDEHEDCPPVGSDEADALEVAADIRKLLDSAPAHIWLDLGENLEALDDNASFRDLAEVTWSEDNATGTGIKYVRACDTTDMRELLATFTDWARQVASRPDVPPGIRSAAANLHDDGKRLIARTTGANP